MEVDEAVEVEVAGGPGLLGGLPVVGEEGLGVTVMLIGTAVPCGIGEAAGERVSDVVVPFVPEVTVLQLVTRLFASTEPRPVARS